MSKRFHARATMLGGVGAGALGLALMAALVSVAGGYLSMLPGMFVIGFGVGLAMPLATEAITSLPGDRQGVASALNDVTRELGNAVGVALLRRAFVDGWSRSMWIGAAAMSLLFMFLLLRAPRRATTPLHAPDLGGAA